MVLGKKSRLFVSPLIILMVSLLSGCSLMEKAGVINRQCKAAKDTNAEYARDIALATIAYNSAYEEEVKKHVEHLSNCRANPDPYIRKYGEWGNWPHNTKWTTEECSENFMSPNKLKNPPTVVAAYKNYYQVIINNQKCFKPEIVIEAQRYLGLVS